jgi:hypothetical protein
MARAKPAFKLLTMLYLHHSIPPLLSVEFASIIIVVGHHGTL